MNKLEFMGLWDLYHTLLTPHQQEITDLYFNYDLTLSEIAEAKGISRQGVSECLNACKSQLADFEEKLGCLAQKKEAEAKTANLIANVKAELVRLQKLHPETTGDMQDVFKLLNTDNTAE
jgi:hypothetical protein